MNLTRAQVCTLLHTSIDCLYRQDWRLFNYRGKIYERPIVFRLAHYLADLINNNSNLGNNINVDSEYMCHIEDKKLSYYKCESCNNANVGKCHAYMMIKNHEKLPRTIRTDIIIHERKTNKNHVVIEAKTPTKSSENPNREDAAKLSYLTCPHAKNNYHYDIGIAMDIMKSRTRIWFFKDREQMRKKRDITNRYINEYNHEQQSGII